LCPSLSPSLRFNPLLLLSSHLLLLLLRHHPPEKRPFHHRERRWFEKDSEKKTKEKPGGFLVPLTAATPVTTPSFVFPPSITTKSTHAGGSEQPSPGLQRME